MVVPQSAQQLAADSILGELLRGVATAARAEGYRVLIAPLTADDADYEALIRDGHADGLIVSDPRVDDPGLAMLTPDRPVVIHGMAPGIPLPCIDVDNRAAARDVVAYLASLGHERIAYVSHAPRSFTSASQRYEGYREGLSDAGLVDRPELTEDGEYDAASGWRAMTEILARTSVDAVFAGSDIVALGAIGALREAGLDVPGAVSVVGFDDIPLAAYFDPPLTTVHIPAQALGLAAGRAVVDRIAGRPVPDRTILPTKLVERGSTAARSRSPAGTGAR